MSGVVNIKTGALINKRRDGQVAANGSLSGSFSGTTPGSINRMTGNEILFNLLTVDGAGSGLDADLLDGKHAAFFALALHAHGDLYYTEAELNAGQLDSRYYTEVELNAGQLDSRYYTAAEIDAFAVKLTGDQTIAGVKTFTGIVKGDDLISRSLAFVSGFAGAGYRLTHVG